MKTSRLLTACLLLALSFGALAPVAARADEQQPVSFDYFYDALQPYGQWVDVAGYGYCWQPNGVDENWQPYSDGYWVYTDAGWTWVSYEDFGWITYHYGRWTRVEDLGWVWVPDYEWAPAWVSWRESDDYIGWAPLPPECHFQADVGISFWVDSTCDIGPGFYNFCLVRDFGAPALQPVIIVRSRNVTIIANTVNITNITVNNRMVFNGGPNFERYSRRVARPIQTMRLVRETNPAAFGPGRGHGGFAHASDGQLFIAAPLIAKPTHPFHPAKVARVISNVKVDRGWAHVTDPGMRQQLQEKIRTQSRGVKPEQAPAQAVTAQQLSIIPKGNAPTPGGQPRQTGTPGFMHPPVHVLQQPAGTPPAATPAPQGQFQSTPGGTPRNLSNNTPTPGGQPQQSGTPRFMHPPVHVLQQPSGTPAAAATPPNQGQLQPFQPTPGGAPKNLSNGMATPAPAPGGEHERKFQGRHETPPDQQNAAADAAAREQQIKAAQAAAHQQQLMQQQKAAAEAAARQQQFMQQKAAQQQQQQQHLPPQNQRNQQQGDSGRGAKPDYSPSPVR